DVRAFEVGVEALVAETLRRAERPGGEAVLQRAAVARDGVAEGVARHDVARALRSARRMEDAEPAAKDRLRVPVEAIGEPDARAEVVAVGVHQARSDADVTGQDRAAQVLRP